MNLQYKFFKTKDPVWQDETGMSIPVNRVTKAERLTERKTAQIVKKALDLNKRLTDFKRFIKETAKEIYNAHLKENGGKEKTDYKGNFTFYNFDRSVKVEVNVSEPIEFDDIHIQLAQEKLQEFLENNINADNEFIKQLVLDAFKTRRGKLDTKRVLNLTRYVDKVKDPLFKEAVELINKSIRRRPSRLYFRVFVKDDNGSYQNIDLNLSSVEV